MNLATKGSVQGPLEGFRGSEGLGAHLNVQTLPNSSFLLGALHSRIPHESVALNPRPETLNLDPKP